MKANHPEFKSIAAAPVPCKCCDASAAIYGVIDFHKACLEKENQSALLSGIPVYYYRCPACGFIFTTTFDQFSKEQFQQHIYNGEYAQFDPDYADVRPTANARTIARLLRDERSIRILDYGGGNGALAEKLRDIGFTNVASYDPMVLDQCIRPEGLFDLIVCFEVVEHSPTPRETFAEMISLLKQPGMIIFSTLFQPQNIDEIGLRWWYAAPRNGHVSLFSQQAMERLGESLGFRLGSFSENLHILVKDLPDFARSFAPKE